VSQFNECINLSKIASFSSLLEISFRKPGNANPWGDSSISFREAVSSALKIRRLLGRFVSMLIHLRLFIIT
jgi:hypothetical protein